MSNRARPAPNLMCEHQVLEAGFERIAGIDECGRGTWAGPVVAAAVCLPLGERNLTRRLAGVRDSKEMTPRQRADMVDTIKAVAGGWGIGSATNLEVDSAGIVGATKLAMARALDLMRGQFPDCEPQCLFLDAMVWPEKVGVYPQVSIVDGDARSLSIAAASVLAKVWRDDLMAQLDAQYPEYGFAVHKGYGTSQHLAALRRFGPCPLHRLTFKPVQQAAQNRA